MRHRLVTQILVASAVLMVLVAASFAGLVRSVQAQRDSAELAQQSQRVLVAASNLERLVLNLQSGTRGYVITGRVLFLEPTTSARASFSDAARELVSLVEDDPAQLGLARGISIGAERFLADVIDPLIVATRSDLDAARQLVAEGAGRRQIDVLHEQFVRFSDAQRAIATQSAAEADDEASRAVLFGVGSLIGTALLIAMFAAYLTRSVVAPVRRVAEGADRLAGGDLAARVPGTGRGEVGQLARAFNEMASSLEGARETLLRQKGELERRGAELERALDDLSRQSARVDAFYRFAAMLADETDVERLAQLALEAVCRHAGAQAGTLAVDEPAVVEVRLGPDPSGCRHRLDVPLSQGGREIGRFTVCRTNETPFSARDREAVEHLAGQAAQALARAVSFRDARRQAAITGAVLDAAPDVITFVDPDGRTQFRNKPTGRLLHGIIADAEDATVYDLVARFAEFTTDPAGYVADIEAIRRDPEAASRTEFTLAASGRVFQRYTAPVRDSEQDVIGRLFVVREVTGERESDRMKDEFIALASHELRTPLTSIIGYLEVVLDGEAGPLSAEQQRFVEVAARNADRLLRLVGDLIVVGQADAGRLTLSPAPLDLGELASDRAGAAQPGAEDRGVELAVHADAPAPIVGDASRLGQVLDNLISNALKFTPSGGRVDVSVAAAADGVVLEVRDTGAGIPAAEQERLFERFYRTEGAQAGAVPGTGLGLSIVRAIVEAHHGRIALESAEGKGSAFRVWLPEGDGAHNAAADLNATGKES